MSTSFDLIYSKFLDLITAPVLALLSKEDLKTIMYVYLDRAVSLDFKQCKKNLKLVVAPSSFIKEFIGDGVAKDFVIDESPILNSVLIARVNDIDIDYTFNSNTNTFSFVSSPSLNTNVKVGWSFAGLFNENLDSEEQWILACAMLLGWLEPKIKDEELLKNDIGDRDYKESSHANLLRELTKLDADTKSKLMNYIRSYTFNGFEGLS